MEGGDERSSSPYPVRLQQLAAVMDDAIALNQAGRSTGAQQLQRTQANPVLDRIVDATDQLASNAMVALPRP